MIVYRLIKNVPGYNKRIAVSSFRCCSSGHLRRYVLHDHTARYNQLSPVVRASFERVRNTPVVDEIVAFNATLRSFSIATIFPLFLSLFFLSSPEESVTMSTRERRVNQRYSTRQTGRNA